MRINFKQRTIDNKIKIYDSIISSWVKMRNLIYSRIENNTDPSKKWFDLDQAYGESQTFIGETFLVSDNTQLAQDINIFNEKFYRSEWHKLTIDQANNTIEALKQECLLIIDRMRADIKESAILHIADVMDIFKGTFSKNSST